MQNYSTWMSDHLSSLGKKKIKHLILPASHDSGMSVVTQSTEFSNSSNTQTQQFNFKEQLDAGIRYFDLRPVIGGGQFYLGHYTRLKIENLGAIIGSRGLCLNDFIEQVNGFTKNNKELIIIRISHAYNTDSHERKKCWGFNETEWKEFINALKKLNDRCSLKMTDLSNQYLEDFVGTSGGLVLCFETKNVKKLDVNLLDYNEGMYPDSILNLSGEYTDSIDVIKMSTDQVKQMQDHAKKSISDIEEQRKALENFNALSQFDKMNPIMKCTQGLKEYRKESIFGKMAMFEKLDDLSKMNLLCPPHSGLFKVSWTLTMQLQQALAASVHPNEAHSIKYFADEAWSHINTLYKAIDNRTYPNIISIDYVNSDLTKKCIDLNKKTI